MSVTALPGQDLADTVGVTLECAASDEDTIPHLAATRISRAGELDAIVRRLSDSGTGCRARP